MSTYLCRRCNYTSKHYNNIKKHLNRKNQCSKEVESYNYSDDQLLIFTLFPELDRNCFEYLKKSCCISKNKGKLFDIYDDIHKNKLKRCTSCNQEFDKINDLKKHIIECFFNTFQDCDKKNVQQDITIEGNNNIVQSQCTINNTNHITNIYLELKNPIPFDEEWDISKIDIDKKTNLLFSKIMYTGLLEEILKNKMNLNVIIDKDNSSGIVYKNDIEKYIEMELEDIVKNSMDKLHKHLLSINNDSDNKYFEECLEQSKRMIEKKYNDYITNAKTQKVVKDFISTIYEQKKEDAVTLSNYVNCDGF